MKIFLDANILVSGILCMGNEHDLLIKNKKIVFVTSEDVIDETIQTITRKFPESLDLVTAFLKLLRLHIVSFN